ncbi:MAG: protease, partial [Candidatus Bathyarchaeia archaeon]
MSLKLGNLVGIPVTLHYTWFIAFLLFSWTLAVAYMPQTYPGLSMPVYWFIGIISTLILFGSVLVHELSHSYLARRSGQHVSRISLFIF